MKGNLCSCIYCKKELSSKGIYVHVDRTHLKVTKYSSGYNGKYQDESYREMQRISSNKRWDEEKGKNKEFAVCCTQCDTTFIVIEREREFPKKERYFCNRKCASKYASARNWTETRREQVLNDPKFGFRCPDLQERSYKTRTGNEYRRKEYCYTCKNCEQEFKSQTKNRIFCTRGCKHEYNRSRMDKMRAYRLDSSFKFDLKDYPDEFDFTLIEQFGWYSPSNKLNNLNGVSRDHMVSVKYGFDHNIDPKIIGHPANCKLLQHSDNKSKHTTCSITVDELLKRISYWDTKYGPLV